MSKHVRATMREAEERLKQSGIIEKILKVGAKAPGFTLPNIQRTPISSEQLLKNGPLVISFYRGGYGNERWEIPVPATYVIDTDGNIVHAFVDTDYTKRLEPAEIIKAIKEMVFLTLKNLK